MKVGRYHGVWLAPRVTSPRRVALGVVVTTLGLVLAGVGALNFTFRRAGIAAVKELTTRASLRWPGGDELDGDAAACSGRVLDEMPAGTMPNEALTPEREAWLHRLQDCHRYRWVMQDATRELEGWSARSPMHVLRLVPAVHLTARYDARAPDGEARCLAMLEVLADRSHLGLQPAVAAARVSAELMHGCYPRFRAAGQGGDAALAARLERVLQRWARNGELLRLSQPTWEAATFWPWVPLEARTVVTPDHDERPLLAELDEARAMRRAREPMLKLMQQADARTAARAAASLEVDGALASWLDPHRAASLESSLSRLDDWRDALSWLARTLRGQPAPLPGSLTETPNGVSFDPTSKKPIEWPTVFADE